MKFVEDPELINATHVVSSPDTTGHLPRTSSADPADRIDFTRPDHANFTRFDQRSDAILREVALSHPLAIERERAVWELADRHGINALSTIQTVALRDENPVLRWGCLWLIQKTAGDEAATLLQPFARDEHPEVSSWAQLLYDEVYGSLGNTIETRRAKFDERNPFDQTLPLLIAGHAHTNVPGLGWFRATLSPLWFESIMGRVMACTRVATFDTDLIIEKRISDFYPDGSNHYEIYRFRGVTFAADQRSANHIYSGISKHTFYPSGKVQDASAGRVANVIVNANRAAKTVRIGAPLRSPETRRQQLVFERVVQSVRGRYYGTAYVNVTRLLADGMALGAGTVQLTDVHHPVVGLLTNTFLCGSFKGKLSDIDGDGLIDVNTEPCHSTIEGELDYCLSGSPNPDPHEPA